MTLGQRSHIFLLKYMPYYLKLQSITTWRGVKISKHVWRHLWKPPNVLRTVWMEFRTQHKPIGNGCKESAWNVLMVLLKVEQIQWTRCWSSDNFSASSICVERIFYHHADFLQSNLILFSITIFWRTF